MATRRSFGGALAATLGLAIALLVFGPLPAQPGGPTAMEQQVIELLNRIRADPANAASHLSGLSRDAGLMQELRATAPMEPLTFDPRLAAAARAHAEDLARRGEISHTGADGSGPMVRIRRQGLTAMMVAEEVSQGQRDAAGVLRQLLIDAGVPGHPHRRDLLNPRFRLIGVGCAPAPGGGGFICVINMTGPEFRPDAE